MKSAITTWIGPIVVVEVDPNEFDSPGCSVLLARLDQFFMQSVALITPDWEAEDGIRAKGLPCPTYILSSPDLVWRTLELPQLEETPF